MSKARNFSTDAENEEIIELRLAIEALMDYVESLRGAVDDLTREMEQFNRHMSSGLVSIPHPVLTSMPLDPTAQDWQINRLSSADLPKPPVPAPRRQTLFD